jgi:hypothetical protein
MWQYDPRYPHIQSPPDHSQLPDYELELSPLSMELMEAQAENSALIKDIEEILRDVERALSNSKKTLGELDRALNEVERTLNGVEEVLSSKEPISNEGNILPHFQCLYDPVAQAAVESALAEAEEQGREQLHDTRFGSALMSYGPPTGDTIQWYCDQDDRYLEEVLDVKRLVPTLASHLDDEELPRGESDLVRYAADNEESPLLQKGFKGWGI